VSLRAFAERDCLRDLINSDHVHVIAPRGQAKILVDGPEGHPRLKWTFGLSRAEIAQGLAAVEDDRELILTEWERVHDQP
jgi:hypothetical protein